MNRRFLAVMMAMVLSGSILAGCGASNENTVVSENVQVVIEETTEDEAVTEAEDEVVDAETEIKEEIKEEIEESTESVADDEGE